MIAILTQLHEHVVHRGVPDWNRASRGELLQQLGDGFVHQRVVELALLGDHLRVEKNFFLARQRELDVALQASQQEWSQNTVQFVHHLGAMLVFAPGGIRIRDIRRIFLTDAIGKVKPRLKLRQRTKDVGEQKMQQRPQLWEVVLQRRTSEQQLVPSWNEFQLTNEFTIKVLQTVPFVHDQILEVVLLQKLAIRHHDFVRRDDDGELWLDWRRRRQVRHALLRAFLSTPVI